MAGSPATAWWPSPPPSTRSAPSPRTCGMRPSCSGHRRARPHGLHLGRRSRCRITRRRWGGHQGPEDRACPGNISGRGWTRRSRPRSGRPCRPWTGLGAELVEVSPAPHRVRGGRPTTSSRRPRPRSNLARYDGVKYGARAEGKDDLLEMYRRPGRRDSAPRCSGGSCWELMPCRPAITTPTMERPPRCGP